ncbi:MAG: T9SS type A sorting domain-containing protein [Bacteroidetes bacterium]|nr:T9SS type A sorting domain-containing protein [Bacteroidota bacterium]
MKQIFTLLFASLLYSTSFSQQNYSNFEGTKNVSLAEWNGIMDSVHVNPLPNAVNSSTLCAKYIRDTATYDNFKFFPYSKLTDVTPYASASSTQKITMKIFTSSPIGTKIDVQLGTRTNTTYPAGVHSIYTASTTAQNVWQVLSFNYVMNPTGSTTLPTDIDKIVVLVRPNSHVRDTIYFDDPTGPQLTVIGIREHQAAGKAFTLFQNKPNPAKENTQLKFQLNTEGNVSLKLYDILGKPVNTIIEQRMNEGNHTVNVETAGLSNGIYFFVLNKDGMTQSVKMVVSN